MPEKESCGECKFYSQYEGYCKRYPPAVIVYSMGGSGSEFPIIPPSDWCGEFVPRKKPTLREIAEDQR